MHSCKIHINVSINHLPKSATTSGDMNLIAVFLVWQSPKCNRETRLKMILNFMFIISVFSLGHSLSTFIDWDNVCVGGEQEQLWLLSVSATGWSWHSDTNTGHTPIGPRDRHGYKKQFRVSGWVGLESKKEGEKMERWYVYGCYFVFTISIFGCWVVT